MEVKRKYKTSVILQLEEWEARNLVKLLNRIKTQKTIGKSEFSLAEKVLGRKLLSELELVINEKPVNKGGFQEQPLPPVALDILEKIQCEDNVPTGSTNKDISNALTLLRRRGFIVNTGTRRQPNWKVVE